MPCARSTASCRRIAPVVFPATAPAKSVSPQRPVSPTGPSRICSKNAVGRRTQSSADHSYQAVALQKRADAARSLIRKITCSRNFCTRSSFFVCQSSFQNSLRLFLIEEAVMVWQQVYNPLGSMALSTLVAAVPVVVMLVGLGFLHLKAHIAAGAGLLS